MTQDNTNDSNERSVNIRMVRIQLETLLTERGWTQPGLALRLNVPQGRLAFILKHPKASASVELADKVDFVYHHEPLDQEGRQSSICQLVPGLKDPNCDISEAQFQDDLQVLLTNYALCKPDLAEALYLNTVKLNYILMSLPGESKPYPVSYWARLQARHLRTYFEKQTNNGQALNFISGDNDHAHFYRPFHKDY